MMDPDNSAASGDSLYTRLGGYDAIAAFVADLMPRLYGDAELWVYWKGKSVDSRRRGEQLLIEFLCAAFGGPAFYGGPDMKAAHRGLGITEAEWAVLIGHIAATAEALDVPERERAEVMEASNGLKWDIVEVPRSSAAE